MLAVIIGAGYMAVLFFTWCLFSINNKPGRD